MRTTSTFRRLARWWAISAWALCGACSARPAPPQPVAPQAESSAREPTTSAPSIAASAPSSTAPVTSASAAPPAFPGVSCADLRAAANLRFFACTTDCDGGDGAACGALGDIHEREEGGESSGSTLAAWEKGCKLGVAALCEKRTVLLASLQGACKKAPKQGCRRLGDAMLRHRGDAVREEADRIFDQACSAGDAQGCYAQAELNGSWDAKRDHEVIAERLYLRACTMGSAEGCCAMDSIYRRRGETRKLDALHNRTGRLLAFGCGQGGPALPTPPKVQVVVTIDARDEKALSAPDADSLRRTLAARFGRCFGDDAPGKLKAHLDIDVPVAGAATVASSSGVSEAAMPCVRASVARFPIPAAPAARRIGVSVALVAPRKE